MKFFEPFTIVTHKALGSEPMVVIPYSTEKDPGDQSTLVRRVKSTSDGVVFETLFFYPEELETQEESIEREGALFVYLSQKKKELAKIEQSDGMSLVGAGKYSN